MHYSLVTSALAVLCLAVPLAQAQKQDVDLRAADGTLLKATYFSAGKPGPGVVLLHMCDGGQRRVWDTLGTMLAARGLHVIAPDLRGYGESGGGRLDDQPRAEQRRVSQQLWPGDLDLVFEHLTARPGVDRSRIGAAGGSCGGGQAVLLAARHPEIKTLVLLAGGITPAPEFLPRVPWMPIFAVASRDDGDSVAAMRRVLGFSTNAQNRFKEYPAGGHGTELFRTQKDLEPAIADWFVQHLITKPVTAPARGGPSGP